MSATPREVDMPITHTTLTISAAELRHNPYPWWAFLRRLRLWRLARQHARLLNDENP